MFNSIKKKGVTKDQTGNHLVMAVLYCI